uniref:Uncharacterized protein n=1 Tax=Avena sativa TaxID=4498 RepID=A0ACD5YDQ3_AVESA
MAWTMRGGRRDATLKPQAAKWVPQNDDYLYDARALHIDTQFSPAVEYIDLLNRRRYRDPALGRTKLEATDQRKRRQEACEKSSRELVDGLVEYISSDNENYKYVVIASKENANMIMEEGFISSNARDEILDGLERIEKDVQEEKFQWRNNKDIQTNIIEALIEIVEGPAKRLDEVISHYDQMLTVLNLWCNESIDKFVTRIKELQVELVLLAIRNEGLVVSCSNRAAGCILLGDMVLSKVEQVISYDFLSNGGLHHVNNSIMDFGNLIIGDIAHDLTDLANDLDTQSNWSLIPYDEVTKSKHLMLLHKIDLDTFYVMGHSGSIYNASADSSKRFLKAYRVVPEMIKAATEFARNLSFNPSFPPGFVGDPKLAGFRASKDLEQLYAGEAAAEQTGATVKQDFKSHSDDTARKLLDWLRRLYQSEQKS